MNIFLWNPPCAGGQNQLSLYQKGDAVADFLKLSAPTGLLELESGRVVKSMRNQVTAW